MSYEFKKKKWKISFWIFDIHLRYSKNLKKKSRNALDITIFNNISTIINSFKEETSIIIFFFSISIKLMYRTITIKTKNRQVQLRRKKKKINSNSSYITAKCHGPIVGGTWWFSKEKDISHVSADNNFFP